MDKKKKKEEEQRRKKRLEGWNNKMPTPSKTKRRPGAVQRKIQQKVGTRQCSFVHVDMSTENNNEEQRTTPIATNTNQSTKTNVYLLSSMHARGCQDELAWRLPWLCRNSE